MDAPPKGRCGRPTGEALDQLNQLVNSSMRRVVGLFLVAAVVAGCCGGGKTLSGGPGAAWAGGPAATLKIRDLSVLKSFGPTAFRGEFQRTTQHRKVLEVVMGSARSRVGCQGRRQRR